MRLLFAAVLIAGSLIGGAAHAQTTYNGSGATITDATFTLATGATTPATTLSTITVTDTFNVAALQAVTITGLTHTAVGDLVIRLSHLNAAGTTVLGTVDLANRVGQVSSSDPFDLGDDSNLNGTYTFAPGGASLLAAALTGTFEDDIAPGTYAPSTNQDASVAGSTNYGTFTSQPVAGLWRLSVTDAVAGDTGAFTAWSFRVTAAVTVPEPSALSLLPLGAVALALVRRRRTIK